MDPTHLHPTLSRLLVHLDPGTQSTPSGLFLPPDSQQITRHGVVLAVGPDQTDIPVGSRVLLELLCGIEVARLQNTPVLLVEPTDVIALLEL